MFVNLSTGMDLCVGHVTGGKMELLEPLRVTQTHVFVAVTDLSPFVLLKKKVVDFFKGLKPAQVLLFRQPPGPKKQILHVYLLPASMDPKVVRCCLLNS